MISEALTLARNFGPWFGGVAIVAVIAGGGLGSCVTKRFTEHRALTAETALANVRAEIATQAAEQERKAAELQQAAQDALRQRDDVINARLAEFPVVLRQTLRAEFAKQREIINAPRFDCLRTEPLPDDFIDGLRREGGQVRPQGH